ncbi:MAG: thioredoxin domain-containing protein [Candidatus Hydrothermarchaeota archaeon]
MVGFRPGVLLLVLVLLAGCTGGRNGERMVGVGDMVEIGYIATLQGGDIFDTTYEDVALNGSLSKDPYFRTQGPYEPLILRAGMAEEADITANASLASLPQPPVVESLREAVVGMRIGEEKVVEVPPEKGYGPRDERLVEVLPRRVRVAKTEVVSAGDFLEAAARLPVKGERVKFKGLPWDVTVLDFNSTDVTLEHDPVLGTSLRLMGTSWNSTVVGAGEVITLMAEVAPGEFVLVYPKMGLVKEAGEESFTVDFNRPYAGERLIFRLRVLNATGGGIDEARRISATEDDPSMGPEDAPVTVVVFGDFECPYTKITFLTLNRIVEEYKGKVRVVYRDFPNPRLPSAEMAAEAAGCAQEGGKYWEYAFQLFKNQGNLTAQNLLSYAREAGLNGDGFEGCLASKRMEADVRQDLRDGRMLGVTGTPTFFVNGRRSVGSVSISEFDGSELKVLIDEELNR